MIEEAKAAKLFKEASKDIAKAIQNFDETEDFEDDGDYEELPDYYWTEEYQNYVSS